MDNFEELDEMLGDIIRRIPSKKKKLLENVGDILEKQVLENIESRVNTSSDRHEKEKLKKDVKQIIGSKNGYVAVKPSYENSSINHLLENGHKIVRNGIVVGFANGKHMYRDSIEQCENKIFELAEELVNEVINEYD